MRAERSPLSANRVCHRESRDGEDDLPHADGRRDHRSAKGRTCLGRRADHRDRERSSQPLLVHRSARSPKVIAEDLDYTADIVAPRGDTESTLIDTAITNKWVAIMLHPTDANGSVGAVHKAVDADIPVFLVNAEINQKGGAPQGNLKGDYKTNEVHTLALNLIWRF